MSKIGHDFRKKRSSKIEVTKNVLISKKTAVKRPFFVKKTTFFPTSIFEPLYILKSCPIFDKFGLPVFPKYNGFL